MTDIEQHRRIAEDLLAVYNSADPQAATRLNDLFHSTLNIQQIRDFIRDKLFNLPDTQQRINNLTLSDAEHVVARLYGFKDWAEFVQSMYCRDTTDVATSHIVGMPKLKKYHAGYTLITDASLRCWAKLNRSRKSHSKVASSLRTRAFPF